MQIRAIIPLLSPSPLLLPPNTHFPFIFLGDEVCLAGVQSFPLSQTDHEWAEPCSSTLLIFHLWIKH